MLIKDYDEDERKDSWNRQYAAEAVKKTLLDLLIYLFFLAIISIVSYGSAGTSTYYLSDMLKKKFVEHPFDLNAPNMSTAKIDETTFAELITVQEYWAFLEILMLPTIYEDSGDTPVRVDADLFLEEENILLGPPRLRQVRVQNASCTVHTVFANKFRNCYGPFRESIEETEPFGQKNGTAWTHTSSADLNGIFYWGKVGSYPGGGYYQDLTLDSVSSIATVAELESNRWIDRATRIVLVEFSIYNANMNLFCVAKLAAEFPATGGVITSHSFPTVKLLRFVSPFDYFVLVCEIVFLIQTIYFAVIEVCEILRERCNYFHNFWNYIDLAIVAIAFTSLGFSAYRYFNTWNILPKSNGSPITHINMDRIAFWQRQFNAALAICVFMVWIKVFKYMSFNKIMLQLSTTLSRCAKDLLAFGLMFFIVFIAYAQLGYILFGTDNPDFRTYTDSILTLMRTVLGDFDYLAIEQSNRILGPIYFVTYIFFVFFVLLNMFLAIINDTYSEVKTMEDLQKVHVGSFLQNKLIALRNTFMRWTRSWDFRHCRKAENIDAISAVSVSVEASPKYSVETVIRDEELSPSKMKTSSYEAFAEEMLSRHPLRGIFQPVTGDMDTVENSEIFNRRLTVVEQTLETIVFRLNGFLGHIDEVLDHGNNAVVSTTI